MDDHDVERQEPPDQEEPQRFIAVYEDEGDGLYRIRAHLVMTGNAPDYRELFRGPRYKFYDVVLDQDYEILGVTLVGPPPIGVVHVRWTPGLTVLYGLNGAGKTAILRTVADVLHGRAIVGGQGFLHLSVSPLDENQAVDRELIEREEEETFTKILTDGIEAGLRSRHVIVSGDEIARVASAPTLQESIRIALGVVAGGDEDRRFIDELATSNLVSLLASGSGHEPHYRLFVSARPSEDTPALNSTLRELGYVHSLFSESVDGEEGVPEESTGHEEAPRTAEWSNVDVTGPVLTERPDWAPIPLIEIGGIRRRLASTLMEDASDAVRATDTLLSAWAESDTAFLDSREMVDGASSRVDLDVARDILTKAANSMYGKLLAHAPELYLDRLRPSQWVTGRYAEWWAFDTFCDDPVPVPLAALSSAQSRWASIAIQWATDSIRPVLSGATRFNPPHRVVLIDEPEQALHSRAVDHLFEGLANLARTRPSQCSCRATPRSP